MLDLLLAAITFPLIIAVGLALLAAVTLVPFVLALQMAQRRAFSPTRWGAVALVGSLLGLAFMLFLYRSERVSGIAVLLPITFTWAGPAALWLLSGEEAVVGGRSGAHEA